MFTTEPSMKAMLDPRIVAASVRRLRRCDSAAGNAGVARMTPASPGGRVTPNMQLPERVAEARWCASQPGLATRAGFSSDQFGRSELAWPAKTELAARRHDLA